MAETIFLGLLILGAIWLAEHIGLYLYWSALGVVWLLLLFVMVVFIFPFLHDFLLNL